MILSHFFYFASGQVGAAVSLNAVQSLKLSTIEQGRELDG